MQNIKTIGLSALIAACVLSSVATADAPGNASTNNTGASNTGASTNTNTSNAPSNEELYEIIQAQQEQIDSMNKEQSSGGLGAVSIGGYGELHYNNIKDEDDEIDFHRFVLYFGYEFSDTLRFFSEVELEHALSGDDKPGEVELEQAYIEYDISNRTHIKGGVFLIPVGFLNETHEPPTFYGVERNQVEKDIIPTTWWEAGAALNGELVVGTGLSYDVALTSGLLLNSDNGYKIRSGRQKVAEAKANDFALTGRLKYTGVRGLELASTIYYQDDVTQDTESEEISGLLIEAHADYNTKYWGMKALVANWELSGDEPEDIGRDKQRGGFLEASFKPVPKVGIYTRYSHWDNNAGDNDDTDWDRIEAGVNYWPHEDVVLKFDIFDQEQNDDNDASGFNLGIGYQFNS